MRPNGNERKTGFIEGRVLEQERMYQTIELFLNEIGEKKNDGKLTYEQYAIMEATALYILHKLKGNNQSAYVRI